MDIIKIYKVAGKTFDNYQEATKYEQALKDNLTLRARNLKVFYWNMLGYPGESTAIKLINNFCNHHKFTFGKWKGRCIGEIMMIFPEYIKWYIENVSFFKMNKYENALWNTSWTHHIGGISWDVTHDEVKEILGDDYDNELIEWEKHLLIQDNSN